MSSVQLKACWLFGFAAHWSSLTWWRWLRDYLSRIPPSICPAAANVPTIERTHTKMSPLGCDVTLQLSSERLGFKLSNVIWRSSSDDGGTEILLVKFIWLSSERIVKVLIPPLWKSFIIKQEVSLFSLCLPWTCLHVVILAPPTGNTIFFFKQDSLSRNPRIHLFPSCGGDLLKHMKSARTCSRPLIGLIYWNNRDVKVHKHHGWVRRR